jgi:hypothetical protein
LPTHDECAFAQAIFPHFFVPFMHVLLAHIRFYVSLYGTVKIGECQRGENHNKNDRLTLKNTGNHQDMFKACLVAQVANSVTPAAGNAAITDVSIPCSFGCGPYLGNKGAHSKHLAT